MCSQNHLQIWQTTNQPTNHANESCPTETEPHQTTSDVTHQSAMPQNKYASNQKKPTFRLLSVKETPVSSCSPLFVSHKTTQRKYLTVDSSTNNPRGHCITGNIKRNLHRVLSIEKNFGSSWTYPHYTIVKSWTRSHLTCLKSFFNGKNLNFKKHLQCIGISRDMVHLVSTQWEFRSRKIHQIQKSTNY